jgi:hypothetical protein
MIRLAPLTGSAVLSAPIAEFLMTDFLAISMAIEDLGGRLPRPAGGTDVDLSAAQCRALIEFLASAEPAALLERLDRRLPGEGAAALRARLDLLTGALRTGASGDGLRIETD